MVLTTVDRCWLQDARRSIRLALLRASLNDWEAVVASASNIHRNTTSSDATVIEVRNLLASLATTAPSHLKTNRAMREAAKRRLNDAILLIGETLVATTDR